MNLLEALSRKLKNDWTGGASGDPGRYHAPGAFEDFRIADLFNNDRWTREPMVDPNSSSGFLENRDGTPRYTSYYKPRGAVDVTETDKIGDKTVVTKYKVAPEKSNYEVFPYHHYDPGSSVTSEPFPRVAGSGARVSDPMNTRPGTFIGSLHHPPNIAGMGSRVGELDPRVTSEPYNPTPFKRRGYSGAPRPALRPRRIEDEGREEEIWEFYKKLREAGYSEEDAAKATAIFLSGGDVYTGLLGEDY